MVVREKNAKRSEIVDSQRVDDECGIASSELHQADTFVVPEEAVGLHINSDRPLVRQQTDSFSEPSIGIDELDWAHQCLAKSYTGIELDLAAFEPPFTIRQTCSVVSLLKAYSPQHVHTTARLPPTKMYRASRRKPHLPVPLASPQHDSTRAQACYRLVA